MAEPQEDAIVSEEIVVPHHQPPPAEAKADKASEVNVLHLFVMDAPCFVFLNGLHLSHIILRGPLQRKAVQGKTPGFLTVTLQ